MASSNPRIVCYLLLPHTSASFLIMDSIKHTIAYDIAEKRGRIVEQRLDECDDLLEFAVEALRFRLRRNNPNITEAEILAAVTKWLAAPSTLFSDSSMEFVIRDVFN